MVGNLRVDFILELVYILVVDSVGSLLIQKLINATLISDTYSSSDSNLLNLFGLIRTSLSFFKQKYDASDQICREYS